MARAEAFARRSPRLYRWSVVALAFLAYAYLAFWGLVALGAALTLVALGKARPAFIKLGWVLGVVAYQIVRAMWIRLDPAEGLEVTRASAPLLFAELDGLRRAESLPRLHRVLVDRSFNAAVASRPRLGPLGWQQHELIIGLPLFLALDSAHARAVLAHELGHIGGGHGRTGALVYRVRRLWERVAEAFELRRGLGAWIFRGFFRWYVPRFQAFSLVLARAQEREADEMAKRAVGPVTAGEALVGTAVYDRCLDEVFWPSLSGVNKVTAEPPADLFARMRTTLGAAEPEAVALWLNEALAEKTEPRDTHPSLAERLAALGDVPRVPPVPAEPAAMTLLGPSFSSLSAALTDEWRDQIDETWLSVYRDWQQRTRRLAELEALAATRALVTDEHADEAFEHADLVEDVRGSEAAIPLLRSLLVRAPHHVSAQFALGRQLLANGDDEGVGFLERAMQADPDAEVAGCELLADFMAEREEWEKAKAYAARGQRRQREQEGFREERAAVTDGDEILPHDLDPALARVLVARLDADQGVRRAWLGKKRLRIQPEEDPSYVLVVRVRNTFRRSLYKGLMPYGLHAFMREGDPAHLVIERLKKSLQMPVTVFLVVEDGELPKLARKVKKAAGRELYRRGRTPVVAPAPEATASMPAREP